MDSEDHATDNTAPQIVIDTDVLISGLLSSSGPAATIMNLWLAGKFTLLASEQMLGECARILGHPTLNAELNLDRNPRGELMAMLRDETQRLDAPVPASKGAVQNPFDALLLANAIAGDADYLITEEDELLALEQYEEVKIVSSEEFVRALNQ